MNTTENPNAQKAYLIKGDISGIQGFIFNVKSKGAAQSLKGRSFFLKILLEVGMRLVFDSYDIPESEREAAKVSTSGGNFILKLELPNDNKINEIQQVLTKSLELTGLSMMLCAVKEATVAEEDKSIFETTKKNLSQAVRERKYQLLQKDFSAFTPFEKKDILEFYNERGKDKKDNNWSDITEAMRDNSHVSIAKKWSANPIAQFNKFDTKLRGFQFAGYEIQFNRKGVGIDLEKHLESLIPLRNKNIISFEDLVERDRQNNKGIKKLGVLAMDVDNLGFVVEGIKSEPEHRKFDIALAEFFNDKLKEIIKDRKKKVKEWDNRERKNKTITVPKYENRVYVVTAGGDDSFFVGRWNTMLEFAVEIKTEFEKFFKTYIDKAIENNDPPMSISAALVIVHPKFPVIRFADMAESALKAAKYDYPESRGNISIFGEVMKWDVLEGGVRDIRALFQPDTNNRTLNANIKQAISGGLLAKARFKALDVVRGEGLRLSHYWELAYFMRNYGDERDAILRNYQQYLDKAANEPDELRKRNYKLIFPIAARLAELDNRKS